MDVPFRERLSFALLAGVATLFVLGLGLDRHFGLDLEGVMGGRFQAAFSKAWDEGGFVRLRGRPYLTPFPTEPITGELYANHPPLHHWASYLFYRSFGRDEFALRLYPALCWSLCAALILFWVRGRRGRGATVVTLAFLLAAPMIRVYGSMANYESPLILFAFSAHLVFSGGTITRRRGLLGAALFFLAVAHDWPGLFFIPAILLARKLEGRSLLAPLAWMSLGAGSAVVAYLLLLVGWKGGFDDSYGLLRLAFSAGRESRPWEIGQLGMLQLQHLRLGYGLLVFPVLGFALCAALPGSRAAMRADLRLGLAFLVTGLLYMLAFPSRSLDHEFCWFYPVPGLALIVAAVTDEVVGRLSRRAQKVGVVLLLVGLVVYGGLEAMAARPRKELPQPFLEVIEKTNAVLGPDTLVLTPRVYAGAWFYFEPWMVENATDPVAVGAAVDYFERGATTTKKLVIEMMPPLDTRLPPSFLVDHGGQELRQDGLRLWIFER